MWLAEGKDNNMKGVFIKNYNIGYKMSVFPSHQDKEEEEEIKGLFFLLPRISTKSAFSLDSTYTR